MYDLVADVARYPEFLPWCAAARVQSVTKQDGAQILEAELVISFKVFRERFSSQVVLWPQTLNSQMLKIETRYLDGPFKHMNSTWEFSARADGGCDVSFDVDFEFRNAILQGIIGLVFNEAMVRIVRAFEARAASLYG